MSNLKLPDIFLYSCWPKKSIFRSLLEDLQLKCHDPNAHSVSSGILLVEEPELFSEPELVQLLKHLDSENCLALCYCANEPLNLSEQLRSHPGLTFLTGTLSSWQLSSMLQSLADRLLVENDHIYQLLFQQAGLGVAQINSLTGQFIRINEEYSKIIGYSQLEIQKLSFHDISYPDDLEKDLQLMDELLRGKINYFSINKRLIRKNGGIFWSNVTVTPMRFLGQEFTTHIAVVQDIHQQKMAEIHRLEAELLFRQMFEKHDAIMLLINPDNGRIIDANLSAERFYGYSRKKLRSLFISDINQLDVSSVGTKLQQAYRQEQNAFYFEHLLADGQVRTVEVHSTPIIVQQKELLFSIIHDITSRKQVEKALLKSEERYRQIVETADEGIWVIDEENITTFVNQKMATMLGAQSPKDITGRSMFDFMNLDNQEYASNNVARRRTGISETHDFEIIRLDGGKIWTSMSTSPIYNAQNIYQGALAMVTDISQRKEWEQQLQKNLEERELLLREVHHRVKNNFQTIMSMLNLQSRKIKNAVEKSQLQAAKERIRSMALIHEELYHADDMAHLDLADYLKQLIRELYASKNDRREIRLNLDLEHVSLEINPSISFALLAYELISNVFQHAFPDVFTSEPQFWLKLRADSQNISLEVIDNGVGFDESLFYDSESTLGFQLVKQLVLQLDGDIKMFVGPGTQCLVSIARNFVS